MTELQRLRMMDWVGSEIIPHEPHVRAWLNRTLSPEDSKDVIQEAYCRIASLATIDHIRSGRAYFFSTARSIVRDHLRRARIVRIETAAEIDNFEIVMDAPSPEQIASGRQDLLRVQRFIEALPERCRRVFELRKIEGLSQREVAQLMGVPEHTVENDVARGLRLILKAIAEGERIFEKAFPSLEHDEQARNSWCD